MRSRALPWKIPVQLCLVLVVSIANAGNLDFYQDVEPELPEDVAYKEITRYWESPKHPGRVLPRPRSAHYLPWTYDDYLNYRRQKEKKILETLLESPAILDVLQNEKTKSREDVGGQWPPGYDVREDFPRNEEAVLPRAAAPPPYMSVNPAFADYANYPFAKNFFKSEKPYYVRGDPPRSGNSPENFPAAEEAEAERLLKFQGSLANLDASRAEAAVESSGIFGSEPRDRPEFTYKFDEAPKAAFELDKFAIRPNDPRYYEDDARATSVAVATAVRSEATSPRAAVFDPVERLLDPFAALDEDPKSDAEDDGEKFSLMKVVVPDRRAERDPLVVAATRMTNNDIYFIAIVAGCSAAAMFALVLIALTWCRLHRGAKAAADIEYPAYGVTGPNKDISPSGDQRLAHSAQMYHFQHQKQQIIAMENRTAASRDPGSVSEAESDEENEEGDYTVYECPGLASTGEMEVKNPMFHDDPTPATPPQIHKEEDHM